jgi:hypothetical protein
LRKTCVLIISAMKDYLTCVVVLLAVCMAIFATGCSEDSAWGANYGGGSGPVYTGGPPPGSGSVPYVHDGPL